MTDERYPLSAADVVATLAEIFRAQGDSNVAALLRSAEPSINESGWDNWNGGTSFYTLDLAIPVAQFAPLEARVEEVEKAVQAKASVAFKNTGNHVLSSVTITPAVVQPGHQVSISSADEERLWGTGTLKLFISHVSAHKIAMGLLKGELRDLGIAAFVAHEDISPSREWQDEIEKALASMDALTAVLTEGFHESPWTDQEVGYALARRVVIVPIRVDHNPYGFMGRHQAMPGRLDRPNPLARDIAKVLAARPETRARALEAYVRALETAGSWDAAKSLSYLLVETEGYTANQVKRIVSAISDNPEVSNAFRVPERLRAKFG